MQPNFKNTNENNVAYSIPSFWDKLMTYKNTNYIPMKSAVYRVLISTFLCSAIYIIVFSLFQYVNSKSINFVGFHSYPTFNQIQNIPKESYYWTVNSITFGLSIGPIILFLSGFFVLNFLKGDFRSIGIFRLFVFWCSIIPLNIFFCLLITGFAGKLSYTWGLYQGIAVIFTWWNLPELGIFLFSILGVALSVLLGYLITFEVTIFTDSVETLEKKSGKLDLIYQIFLIPSILSGVLILSLSNEYSFILHLCITANYLLIFSGMMLRETKEIDSLLFYYFHINHNFLEICKKDVLNKNPIFFSIFPLIVWLTVYLYFT